MAPRVFSSVPRPVSLIPLSDEIAVVEALGVLLLL